MPLPTTTELLAAWDATRARTQQKELGMSALGGCRKRAGFRINGYSPDPEYSDGKTQAVMGTAIHEAAALGAVLCIPGGNAESLEVEFAGLLGHPDLYVRRLKLLRDIKTLSYTMQLERLRDLGEPRRGDRFQAHTYAAGLMKSGRPVETVEIDYLARDSGEEWIFSEPFSAEVVREAMAWLKQVRTLPLESLPRDYRPASGWCQGCEFFRQCWNAEPGKDPLSVLFTEDPRVEHWALALKDAQARRSRAEDDEADAKGALGYLSTVSEPGEKQEVAVGDTGFVVRFHLKHGRKSFDKAAIAAAYREAGERAGIKNHRPPEVRGEPSLSVSVVKPLTANSQKRADTEE